MKVETRQQKLLLNTLLTSPCFFSWPRLSTERIQFALSDINKVTHFLFDYYLDDLMFPIFWLLTHLHNLSEVPCGQLVTTSYMFIYLFWQFILIKATKPYTIYGSNPVYYLFLILSYSRSFIFFLIVAETDYTGILL